MCGWQRTTLFEASILPCHNSQKKNRRSVSCSSTFSHPHLHCPFLFLYILPLITLLLLSQLSELRSINLLMTTIAPSNSRGMGWRKPVPAFIPTPPSSRPTSETSFTLASVFSGGNAGKGPAVAVACPENSQPPVSPPFPPSTQGECRRRTDVLPEDAQQLAPYCQECLSRPLRW